MFNLVSKKKKAFNSGISLVGHDAESIETTRSLRPTSMSSAAECDARVPPEREGIECHLECSQR